MSHSHNEHLAAVLGRIPSGLFILTAKGPAGEETGMLASWVQQASFDPPAVTVALKRGRYLHDWLAEGAFAAVSVLGATQKKLLGHFAKGFEPGEPAFQNQNVGRSPGGVPVLSEALGWLEGQVTGQVDAGDHTVYILRLTAAGRGANLEAERPWVHLRKSGLGY